MKKNKKVPIDEPVLIIGAGASGLAAGYQLKKHNIKVLIIEGRSRIGGRIWTISNNDNAPIELGAEFIHGRDSNLFKLLKKAQISYSEFKSKPYIFQNGEFLDNSRQWKEIFSFTKKFKNLCLPDRSIATALDYLSFDEDRELIRSYSRYIEGFHAADTKDISVEALYKAEKETPDAHGLKNYRLEKGYLLLLNFFAQHIGNDSIFLDTITKSISLRKNAIQLETSTRSGSKKFTGCRVLLTVPHSVLLCHPSAIAGIEFDPPLKIRESLSYLSTGHGIKIVLSFKKGFNRRFLPDKIFSKNGDCFITMGQGIVKVWWTGESQASDMWIGWSAGPSVLDFLSMDAAELTSYVLKDFGHLFNVNPSSLNQNLIDSYYHNWSTDPFSLGAYTHLRVNSLNFQERLTMPIKNTLFFAGEMLSPKGGTGLVNGAIASGFKAAHDILISFSK